MRIAVPPASTPHRDHPDCWCCPLIVAAPTSAQAARIVHNDPLGTALALVAGPFPLDRGRLGKN